MKLSKKNIIENIIASTIFAILMAGGAKGYHYFFQASPEKKTTVDEIEFSEMVEIDTISFDTSELEPLFDLIPNNTINNNQQYESYWIGAIFLIFVSSLSFFLLLSMGIDFYEHEKGKDYSHLKKYFIITWIILVIIDYSFWNLSFVLYAFYLALIILAILTPAFISILLIKVLGYIWGLFKGYNTSDELADKYWIPFTIVLFILQAYLFYYFNYH